jgi:hypothetical protein
VTAFWKDLMETIWPKKWLLCAEISGGPWLIMSRHRTKADAVMHIEPGLAEKVVHMDDLAPGSIYFAGELP